MKKLLLVLLAVAFACTPYAKTFDAVHPHNRALMTLYVGNGSIDAVRVYDPSGYKIGTVYPGRGECLRFSTGEQRGPIKFVVIGGTSRGSVFYTPAIDINKDTAPGWRIELENNMNISMISIRPYKICK